MCTMNHNRQSPYYSHAYNILESNIICRRKDTLFVYRTKFARADKQ